MTFLDYWMAALLVANLVISVHIFPSRWCWLSALGFGWCVAYFVDFLPWSF